MLDRSLFISEVGDLLEAHGSRLRALCGQAIHTAWVAWDETNDCWYPDEAIILGIGKDNLEIVFWKFNEVALTWSSIDVTTRPAWVAQWDKSLVLAWRKNALPELAQVIGKTITAISVVEHLFKTTVVQDRKDPANVGEERQAWLLHALEFTFGQDRLQLFNALDENGVTCTPPVGPEFRRFVV